MKSNSTSACALLDEINPGFEETDDYMTESTVSSRVFHLAWSICRTKHYIIKRSQLQYGVSIAKAMTQQQLRLLPPSCD